ncbi:MAG TPA: hypothetical protein VM076_14945, partial [Gemmatimonadaceae bacterium]|nr:hypothetical protein [Gemmatimonadaceae bacterium]
ILQKVVSATRLPNGGILVGDLGDYALKQFSATGKYERSFGRKGAGPGEITYLVRMLRCGDSVVAYDADGHRTSVFALDGRYVRFFRFAVPPGQQSPYGSACNGAGTFVHYGWGAMKDMKPGIHRGNVPVWFGGDGLVAGPVFDSVPGSERWGIFVDGQPRGSGPLPLGKQPVIAIGRSRAYVGDADRFEIRVYDTGGRRVGTLQRPEPPVPVTRDDIRAETERAVAEAGESRRAAVERRYADIKFPETLPAYTHMVVDADDHVWIRAFPRHSAATARWSVFSPAGALVAEVDVPKHLEVNEVGRDYLLGRYLDPTEAVPQVHLYRLTRAAPR